MEVCREGLSTGISELKIVDNKRVRYIVIECSGSLKGWGSACILSCELLWPAKAWQ